MRWGNLCVGLWVRECVRGNGVRICPISAITMGTDLAILVCMHKTCVFCVFMILTAIRCDWSRNAKAIGLPCYSGVQRLTGSKIHAKSVAIKKRCQYGRMYRKRRLRLARASFLLVSGSGIFMGVDFKVGDGERQARVRYCS